MNFDELIQSDKPVLVDFYAEWCGPCKWMFPLLDELKERIGDQAEIIKIDVDQYPELAGRYKIRTVPTLIIFRNKEIRWRQSGAFPVNELERLMEENK